MTKRLCSAILLLTCSAAWAVDLKEEFVAPAQLSPTTSAHTPMPWYDRIQLSGMLGVGTLHTDATGSLNTTDNGSYDGHIYAEGSLILNAHLSRHASGYFEWFSTGGRSPWYFNSGGYEKNATFELYEAYVHFHDFLTSNPELLAVKAGFIRIPFGEEYIWESKFANPLIQSTAANPWGNDEGVLLYGAANTWSWFFAVTDGSLKDREGEVSGQSDDHPSKAYNIKIGNQFTPSLYSSVSVMYNDLYSLPGLWIGSNSFPFKHPASPSAKVRFTAYEWDLVTKFTAGELSANLGLLQLRDEQSQYDRNLTWGMIQYKHWVGNDYYAIGRVSQIGADYPYPSIGGEFGQNTSRFKADLMTKQRLQIGLGYTPEQNAIYKLEVSQDRYLVQEPPTSGVSTNSDARTFVGAEAIFKF